MSDKNHQEIMTYLAGKVSAADFNAPMDALGGEGDYRDPKTHFFSDMLGNMANGRHRTELPDKFTGSYGTECQVIAQSRDSHTFTVAFASYSDTGLVSLLHQPSLIPDSPPGQPWASVTQGYVGAVVVHVR
ncbi:hypothetical protein [Streptomyces sp. NPDC046985]|uniref:hypothetical protein n=1 Tax=Streptomyces sp. NPDC046985 TaxID=3155377 RepID=UPI0033D38BAA